MDHEKRACPRIKVQLKTSIAGQEFLSTINVIDLSREGIGFYTGIAFDPQTRVNIVFPGTDGIFDKNEVEAVIWRCEPTGDDDHPYQAAAVYVDADETYLDNIAKLAAGQ